MTEESKKGLLALLVMLVGFVAVDKLILNPPEPRKKSVVPVRRGFR